MQHPPLCSLPLSYTCVPSPCLSSWRPPECQLLHPICLCLPIVLCLGFFPPRHRHSPPHSPLQSGFSRTLLTPSRGFDPGIFHFPDSLSFPDTYPTPFCSMRRTAPPFFSLACLVIADCAAGIDLHWHRQSKQVAPAVGTAAGVLQGQAQQERAGQPSRYDWGNHPLHASIRSTAQGVLAPPAWPPAALVSVVGIPGKCWPDCTPWGAAGQGK